MKSPTLLVALSAAALASGIVVAQTQPQDQPYSQTAPKPAGTPPMESTERAEFTLAKLDRNGDGLVDKDEARVSSSLAATFDKADINKDGKLDAAELRAASQMSKPKQ